MRSQTITSNQSIQQTLATNKLIKNTYTLLALTLLFSAATASLAVAINMPHLGMLVTLGGFFGLMFAVNKTQESAWGLFWVFMLTGFMGLTLGPLVSHYLSLPNGSRTVAVAMGGTGAIFLGLSGYALTTRKDFSFMGGFIMAGVLVAFLAGIGAAIFQIPALSLGVSAMFILLMSGMILWETSNMVHGGETNYISATVSLYVSIYNLFVSLLQILGFMGDD
ncbi:MAG TPA: Bax inhibitor-1/YccA family protein [Gammaproteobacteria bacterium]|nr:Bax inhibitor-1/YccA family protein [Gammaproteobacteria bacterium]